MEPDLVRKTPFGLAMVRLPEHMRDSLLDHGIFPTQTEGELFMQLCIQQVPPDHPEAIDGGIWTSGVHSSNDIDPMNVAHSNSTMVATTPWMEDFVADCINRVRQPAPPGESIAGAPDSSFHTSPQQQQECMDRADGEPSMHDLP